MQESREEDERKSQVKVQGASSSHGVEQKMIGVNG